MSEHKNAKPHAGRGKRPGEEGSWRRLKNKIKKKRETGKIRREEEKVRGEKKKDGVEKEKQKTKCVSCKKAKHKM